MRAIWMLLGCLSVALGAIGVVLPLVPTVPFLLLATFCFARSSERLHGWLLGHPRFGPPILDWQAHGAIRRRVKLLATVSILAVLALSIGMRLPAHLILIQMAVLSLVLLFIWTRPEGPR